MSTNATEYQHPFVTHRAPMLLELVAGVRNYDITTYGYFGRIFDDLRFTPFWVVNRKFS